MPTQEEIDSLVGQKKEGDTGASDQSGEPKVVPIEDYRKVSESYLNLRDLEQRRDKEVHDLRLKVKKYEDEKSSAPVASSSTASDDEDPDNLDDLKKKLEKLGVVQKAEVEIEVERRIKLEEATKKLQADVKAAAAKYPFTNEANLLELVRLRGGQVSVEEAILLSYPKELANFAAAQQEDFAETDSGGRTIQVGATQSEDGKAPIKRGFTGDFASYISSKLRSEVNKNAGVR